jgi:hypothetical protein
MPGCLENTENIYKHAVEGMKLTVTKSQNFTLQKGNV